MGYRVCACCALRDAGQLPLPNLSGAGQILVGGFVGRFPQTNKRPKKAEYLKLFWKFIMLLKQHYKNFLDLCKLLTFRRLIGWPEVVPADL